MNYNSFVRGKRREKAPLTGILRPDTGHDPKSHVLSAYSGPTQGTSLMLVGGTGFGPVTLRV